VAVLRFNTSFEPRKQHMQFDARKSGVVGN